MEAEQEEFDVAKQKIIKTSQLLEMYLEYNNKLKKSGQVYQELNCKYERLQLENDRYVHNFDSLKSKHEQLEKDHDELIENKLSLENALLYANNHIKTMEDDLQMSQELKKASESLLPKKCSTKNEIQRKCKELEQELAKCKNIEIELQNENGKLLKENTNLKNLLDKGSEDKQSTINAIQKEKAGVTKDLNKLQIELKNQGKAHKEMCEQKEKEIQMLNISLSNINDLKKQITTLKQENERLKRDNLIKEGALNKKTVKISKNVSVQTDDSLCPSILVDNMDVFSEESNLIKSDKDLLSEIFHEMIELPRSISPLRSPSPAKILDNHTSSPKIIVTPSTPISESVQEFSQDHITDNSTPNIDIKEVEKQNIPIKPIRKHITFRKLKNSKFFKKRLTKKKQFKSKNEDGILKALQILIKSNFNFTISNESTIPLHCNLLKGPQIHVTPHQRVQSLTCDSKNCENMYMLINDSDKNGPLLGFFDDQQKHETLPPLRIDNNQQNSAMWVHERLKQELTPNNILDKLAELVVEKIKTSESRPSSYTSRTSGYNSEVESEHLFGKSSSEIIEANKLLMKKFQENYLEKDLEIDNRSEISIDVSLPSLLSNLSQTSTNKEVSPDSHHPLDQIATTNVLVNPDVTSLHLHNPNPHPVDQTVIINVIDPDITNLHHRNFDPVEKTTATNVLVNPDITSLHLHNPNPHPVDETAIINVIDPDLTNLHHRNFDPVEETKGTNVLVNPDITNLHIHNSGPVEENATTNALVNPDITTALQHNNSDLVHETTTTNVAVNQNITTWHHNNSVEKTTNTTVLVNPVMTSLHRDPIEDITTANISVKQNISSLHRNNSVDETSNTNNGLVNSYVTSLHYHNSELDETTNTNVTVNQNITTWHHNSDSVEETTTTNVLVNPDVTNLHNHNIDAIKDTTTTNILVNPDISSLHINNFDPFEETTTTNVLVNQNITSLHHNNSIEDTTKTNILVNTDLASLHHPNLDPVEDTTTTNVLVNPNITSLHILNPNPVDQTATTNVFVDSDMGIINLNLHNSMDKLQEMKENLNISIEENMVVSNQSNASVSPDGVIQIIDANGNVDNDSLDKPYPQWLSNTQISKNMLDDSINTFVDESNTPVEDISEGKDEDICDNTDVNKNDYSQTCVQSSHESEVCLVNDNTALDLNSDLKVDEKVETPIELKSPKTKKNINILSVEIFKDFKKQDKDPENFPSPSLTSPVIEDKRSTASILSDCIAPLLLSPLSTCSSNSEDIGVRNLKKKKRTKHIESNVEVETALDIKSHIKAKFKNLFNKKVVPDESEPAKNDKPKITSPASSEKYLKSPKEVSDESSNADSCIHSLLTDENIMSKHIDSFLNTFQSNKSFSDLNEAPVVNTFQSKASRQLFQNSKSLGKEEKSSSNASTEEQDIFEKPLKVISPSKTYQAKKKSFKSKNTFDQSSNSYINDFGSVDSSYIDAEVPASNQLCEIEMTFKEQPFTISDNSDDIFFECVPSTTSKSADSPNYSDYWEDDEFDYLTSLPGTSKDAAIPNFSGYFDKPFDYSTSMPSTSKAADYPIDFRNYNNVFQVFDYSQSMPSTDYPKCKYNDDIFLDSSSSIPTPSKASILPKDPPLNFSSISNETADNNIEDKTTDASQATPEPCEVSSNGLAKVESIYAENPTIISNIAGGQESLEPSEIKSTYEFERLATKNIFAECATISINSASNDYPEYPGSPDCPRSPDDIPYLDCPASPECPASPDDPAYLDCPDSPDCPASPDCYEFNEENYYTPKIIPLEKIEDNSVNKDDVICQSSHTCTDTEAVSKDVNIDDVRTVHSFDIEINKVEHLIPSKTREIDKKDDNTEEKCINLNENSEESLAKSSIKTRLRSLRSKSAEDKFVSLNTNASAMPSLKKRSQDSKLSDTDTPVNPRYNTARPGRGKKTCYCEHTEESVNTTKHRNIDSSDPELSDNVQQMVKRKRSDRIIDTSDSGVEDNEIVTRRRIFKKTGKYKRIKNLIPSDSDSSDDTFCFKKVLPEVSKIEECSQITNRPTPQKTKDVSSDDEKNKKIEDVSVPVRRKRGRPRKQPKIDTNELKDTSNDNEKKENNENFSKQESIECIIPPEVEGVNKCEGTSKSVEPRKKMTENDELKDISNDNEKEENNENLSKQDSMEEIISSETEGVKKCERISKTVEPRMKMTENDELKEKNNENLSKQESIEGIISSDVEGVKTCEIISKTVESRKKMTENDDLKDTSDNENEENNENLSKQESIEGIHCSEVEGVKKCERISKIVKPKKKMTKLQSKIRSQMKQKQQMFQTHVSRSPPENLSIKNENNLDVNHGSQLKEVSNERKSLISNSADPNGVDTSKQDFRNLSIKNGYHLDVSRGGQLQEASKEISTLNIAECISSNTSKKDGNQRCSQISSSSSNNPKEKLRKTYHLDKNSIWNRRKKRKTNNCDILSQIMGDMERDKPKEKVKRTVIKRDIPDGIDTKQWRKNILDIAEITHNSKNIDVSGIYGPQHYKRQRSGILVKGANLPVKINVLLKKLLKIPNEEVIPEPLVLEFKRFRSSEIVEIVIYQVSRDIYDKPDNKYYPAPLMTKTQRIFLGLLVILEKERGFEDILDVFLFKTQEFVIRIGCSVRAAIPLTRLFLAVCRLHGNINRMRTYCCEAFFYTGNTAIPIFFTVLTSWTEVMPLEANMNTYPLAKVLFQLVHLKTCNIPGYNLFNLKALLSQFHGYPKERWNCDEVFEGLFKEFIKNPALVTDYAIRLFCRNKDSKWVYKKVNEYFKPQIYKIPENQVEMKAATIILMGKICRNFKLRSKHDEKCLIELKRWFEDLLEDNAAHLVIKQSITSSVDHLPRKGKKHTDHYFDQTPTPAKTKRIDLDKPLSEDEAT